MVECQGKQTEEQQRRAAIQGERVIESGAPDYTSAGILRASALLSNAGTSARSNSSIRGDAMTTMQRTYGNRAVQRRIHGYRPAAVQSVSTPVQRSPIGDAWDWTKKLIGVDQIGPGIEKITGKAKSGYEWAEKKLLGLFGGGGAPGEAAPSENAPISPGTGSSPEPYMNWEMEDALISNYQLGG